MSQAQTLNFACRVCGNPHDNRLHRAREMFFGTREVFEYVECAVCGTVQIREVPDLGRHYPKDYYSFQSAPAREHSPEEKANLKRRLSRRLGSLARASVADYYCDRRKTWGAYRRPLGRCVVEKLSRMAVGFPDYLKDASISLDIDRRSSVLDVGSGAGDALLSLRSFGFRNLTGIDPYLEAGIDYGNGVRILKAELSELRQQFDLILANHSLEHVADPRAVLEQIRRLLRSGRYAVVRIPVIGHAWRQYGVDWVQLDPPRHLFLFTVQSFASMAREADFEVAEIGYDSTAFQFWGSEQYRRDIPLLSEQSYFVNPEKSVFPADQMDGFASRAQELNRTGEGDQAVFYLRKS